MKIAVIVLAGTDTHEGLGRAVNALETAKELREQGDDMKKYSTEPARKPLARLQIRITALIVGSARRRKASTELASSAPPSRSKPQTFHCWTSTKLIQALEHC